MGRLKTFADSGTLLAADLNNIQDDYEYAYSTYRVIARRSALYGSIANVAQVMGTNSGIGTTSGANSFNATFSANNGDITFYIDPAWFTVTQPNSRITRFNVRAMCLIGGTAPASTLTVGLYPISAFAAGGAGLFGGLSASGTPALAGSTVSFASPAANTQNQGSSGDFVIPNGGWYALGITTSVTTAASSIQMLYGMLEMRQT